MDAKSRAGVSPQQEQPHGRVSQLRSMLWWKRVALTYAIAMTAGALASWVGMPLPWMLGPFFALAALSVAGGKFALIPFGRELGQVAIGVAVGMRFTPAVLASTATLLPEMLAGTIYVIAFTMLAAFLFKPLAGVDDVTAFFATAAGGVADMAHVAKDYGGAAESVAVVHAMRVSGVVALVPFLVVLFGKPGSAQEMVSSAPSDVLSVVLAIALGFAMAWLLKPTPIPNPWLVGSIFMGIILAVSGLLVAKIPGTLIVIAQVMLGSWLGCQFRRELLSALPRVAAAGIIISLFMIGCAAIGALGLSMMGLPFTTSFLALAPAAVTEMVITAQVMHLEAEIVTAFHIMRIAVVSSTVLLMFKLYTSLKGGRLGSSL